MEMSGKSYSDPAVEYLLHDGDGALTKTGFDERISSGDVEVIITAPGAPNMNSHCERVIRSIREEFTDHFYFWGDTALRAGLAEYLDWYHHHRPHQGIGNKVIAPGPEIGATVGTVQMRSRMAGCMVHWERQAA